MPLSNVLSGAAFKSALLSIVFFIPTISVVGYAVYQLVESSLYKELQRQITEELILFEQIENQDGAAGLIEAIAALNSPLQGDHRIVGFFDSDGKHLAGSTQIAPDFVGWKSVSVKSRITGMPSQYYTHTLSLSTSTLIVGRNIRTIQALLRNLARYAALAGLMLLVTTLGFGYLLSHRVNVKLMRMCDVLDEVSQGDMDARLPISVDNDQIDRASRQINTHLEHLAQLMASTRHTIQAVAHDLRNPLQRMSLFLRDALQQPNLGSPLVQTNVEDAARELDNVTDIFDTVLRIARLAGQSEKRSFSTISANQLLNDINDLLLPVADSKNLSIQCMLSTDKTPTLHGDESMLRQMMVNLVENALIHCPEGSTITLSAYISEVGNTVIEVADDGPGIPPEQREMVLEPFHRLDTSRSGGGNGLGLTLVDAIAVRHNAKLTLEDNQPGLRAIVSFPSM